MGDSSGVHDSWQLPDLAVVLVSIRALNQRLEGLLAFSPSLTLLFK